MGDILDLLKEKVGQMFDKHNASPDEKPPSFIGASAQPTNIYDDHDKIRDRIKKSIDDPSKSRWYFDRLWFSAILYYVGNQWITWDTRSRQFREKKLRKYVPKPVNNRFASTLDTIVAAVQSVKVKPSAWPATDDVEDIAAADVADRVIPIIDEEIDSELVREMLANWVVLTADAFAFPHYDKQDTKLGTRIIQSERCQECQVVSQPIAIQQAGGVCPACGLPSTTIPAEDESGVPVGKEYPVGRMKTDVLGPFQVFFELDIENISDLRKFTFFKTYATSRVKEVWPETSKDVGPDRQNITKLGQYYFDALHYATADTNSSSFKGRGERTTLYFTIEMPSADYPEGLTSVMASNETILEAGPTPFFIEEQETSGQIKKIYFNPLVHFAYRRVPGRVYSKSPSFDLLPKQDQLNRLESLIEMIVMKGVYNSWILPTGSSISQIIGEPAQHIRYTPAGTGGAKPEIVSGQAVQGGLLEWRAAILADFEDLGGTFDALKGNVPRGVSAGYAIQLLTERGYGRFGPVYANWERGWTELYKKLLMIFRQYVTEDRIHKIKGDTGEWEIEKFKGSSLTGGVDLRIEGGAARPRSKLAEQALIETLAQLGVLDPHDQNQKYILAEMFGVSHVLGSVGEDRRVAASEWNSFTTQAVPVYLNAQQARQELLRSQPLQASAGVPAQAGQPQALAPSSALPPTPNEVPGMPIVRLVVDNHQVHIIDHQRQAKTDVFNKLPQEIQLIWEQHIKDHMMAVQQLMMQQQGLAGAPPRPSAPGLPGKSKLPSGNKGQETADPAGDAIHGKTSLGGGGE